MTKNDARKIVIVGGVAGGASAATRARRMNEHAEIILLEKDSDVSFANCGLPYHIGGEIEDRSKLVVASADFLAKRLRLDVRTRHEAISIDRQKKRVEVLLRDSGETIWIDYDKLILARRGKVIRRTIRPIHKPEATWKLKLNANAEDDILENRSSWLGEARQPGK